jgi:hypothetical protein
MYTEPNKKPLLNVSTRILLADTSARRMNKKKGRSIMFDKIVLTLIGSMILLGAAIIAVPIPVVWGTGCLIFLALFVALHRQPQR